MQPLLIGFVFRAIKEKIKAHDIPPWKMARWMGMLGKGSRKKVLILVARPLRVGGGGVKAGPLRKKELFMKLEKKFPEVVNLPTYNLSHWAMAYRKSPRLSIAKHILYP